MQGQHKGCYDNNYQADYNFDDSQEHLGHQSSDA